jgi:hypothetical protein
MSNINYLKTIKIYFKINIKKNIVNINILISIYEKKGNNKFFTHKITINIFCIYN